MCRRDVSDGQRRIFSHKNYLEGLECFARYIAAAEMRFVFMNRDRIGFGMRNSIFNTKVVDRCVCYRVAACLSFPHYGQCTVTLRIERFDGIDDKKKSHGKVVEASTVMIS